MEQEKKAKRARRSFTAEFKAGAVRLVLDEGKSISAVAENLDLTASALGKWVEQARADKGKSKRCTLTTDEKEELARLRKDVRVLRVERDILKKAAAPSTGRRNTTRDARSRRVESKDLSWAAVQSHCDDIELVLREAEPVYVNETPVFEIYALEIMLPSIDLGLLIHAAVGHAGGTGVPLTSVRPPERRF